MENKLQQHIEKNIEEIDNVNTSAQRRRHLESELSELEHYKKNHPEETKDPTPLELYCDQHPEALECRMYED